MRTILTIWEIILADKNYNIDNKLRESHMICRKMNNVFLKQDTPRDKIQVLHSYGGLINGILKRS